METDILYCPACQGKVRIPRSLLGTQVQCPRCTAVFLAPPPPTEFAQPSSYSEPERLIPQDEFTNSPRSNIGVTFAGVGLILMALLSLLACVSRLIVAVNPQIMQAIMENNPLGRPPQEVDMKTIFLVWGGLFSVVSIVGFIGGVAMLLRKGYPLAIIGSVATILNFADCFCLPFNFFVGIAALVTLLMPAARSHFER
jgi:hypothetical protein